MRGISVFLLLSAAIGCANSPSRESAPTLSAATTTQRATTAPVSLKPIVRAIAAPAATQAVKPYVLHLPGVSGTSIVDYTLRDGLRAGGFDGPFEIYDWTCHDPG